MKLLEFKEDSGFEVSSVSGEFQNDGAIENHIVPQRIGRVRIWQSLYGYQAAGPFSMFDSSPSPHAPLASVASPETLSH